MGEAEEHQSPPATEFVAAHRGTVLTNQLKTGSGRAGLRAVPDWSTTACGEAAGVTRMKAKTADHDATECGSRQQQNDEKCAVFHRILILKAIVNCQLPV
jgi:hypothetical protein